MISNFYFLLQYTVNTFISFISVCFEIGDFFIVKIQVENLNQLWDICFEVGNFFIVGIQVENLNKRLNNLEDSISKTNQNIT